MPKLEIVFTIAWGVITLLYALWVASGLNAFWLLTMLVYAALAGLGWLAAWWLGPWGLLVAVPLSVPAALVLAQLVAVSWHRLVGGPGKGEPGPAGPGAGEAGPAEPSR